MPCEHSESIWPSNNAWLISKKKVETPCKWSARRETMLWRPSLMFRTLDFGEFLLLLASYQNEERDDYDELNLAFQLFDLGRWEVDGRTWENRLTNENILLSSDIFIDGRDYLDLNSLRQISQQTGLNLSELELQLMLQAADRNGDARVDRHEFIRIMRQTNLFSHWRQMWATLC